jgi:hypothetical protein
VEELKADSPRQGGIKYLQIEENEEKEKHTGSGTLRPGRAMLPNP